ncbi:MAG: type II toxin-antitoxin system VapC family toxin [Candidatus Hydrogenedentes bacterium]|jgi:predicted nucleic acid-binding protein|nr:type II toxin-antitoxin system VapC family toxin [Candidatus Hydrogenedentota bacterium]
MLFDTDVIIWALRGNVRAAAAIDRADSLQISVVTYMELIHGARNKRELQATQKALANLDFQILALSENIGHRASIYLEEYALKSNIGVPDALIAATAVENGQRLCTANAKDYRAITEMQLERFRP